MPLSCPLYCKKKILLRCRWPSLRPPRRRPLPRFATLVLEILPPSLGGCGPPRVAAVGWMGGGGQETAHSGGESLTLTANLGNVTHNKALIPPPRSPLLPLSAPSLSSTGFPYSPLPFCFLPFPLHSSPSLRYTRFLSCPPFSLVFLVPFSVSDLLLSAHSISVRTLLHCLSSCFLLFSPALNAFFFPPFFFPPLCTSRILSFHSYFSIFIPFSCLSLPLLPSFPPTFPLPSSYISYFPSYFSLSFLHIFTSPSSLHPCLPRPSSLPGSPFSPPYPRPSLSKFPPPLPFLPLPAGILVAFS